MPGVRVARNVWPFKSTVTLSASIVIAGPAPECDKSSVRQYNPAFERVVGTLAMTVQCVEMANALFARQNDSSTKHANARNFMTDLRIGKGCRPPKCGGHLSIRNSPQNPGAIPSSV